MDEKDREKLIDDYSSRYGIYGYSPKTLGWDKGKQDIRFEILTSQFEMQGKKILDIGCGFGDLCYFLDRKQYVYDYCGIDLVEPLVREAKKRHSQYNFILGDFLQYEFNEMFDFAVASGIFNRKFVGTGKTAGNYSIIEKSIEKALDLVQVGIAFDFLSDQVDYQYEHTFHSSPSMVLDIAYRFSRNVMLRNDYMPFEFSLFIFKDDTFDKDDTLFCAYKQKIFSSSFSSL